jgi:hypothetical protein
MQFSAVVVSAHLPSQGPVNVGVLVLDEEADRLRIRFRRDLEGIADPPDLEVLQGMAEMIESLAVEMGSLGVLQYLEDSASNAIRLGDRITINADNAAEALDLAFAKHVA